MKILVDENIPRITVESLRAAGHDVKDMRGAIEEGSPDADVWHIAVAESRLLITTDKGFTAYRNSAHHGILVVRLRQPNRDRINSAVKKAMQRFSETQWQNRLVVVRDKTMSTSRYKP
jgi:predicted nuclease of predicted toxin-antitoxin system